MKKTLYITSLLLLSACIRESELKPILPVEFLNDDNSKIWEVNAHRGSIDPLNPAFNTLIFYNNGYVFLHPRNNLDATTGFKGQYGLSINEEDTLLYLKFKDYEVQYAVTAFTKDSINLKPKKTDASKDTPVQLLPFSMPY